MNQDRWFGVRENGLDFVEFRRAWHVRRGHPYIDVVSANRVRCSKFVLIPGLSGIGTTQVDHGADMEAYDHLLEAIAAKFG